jgi:hypothetical protein
MRADIVKRLRVPSDLMTEWTHVALHGEAADEIERLRARVAGLERVREAAEAWREDMTMPTDHARSGVIGRRLITALAEATP